MSNIVDNLKKLCEEHEKHLSDIRQRINEIEYYPLAKSLVGKCFKYKDSSNVFVFNSSPRTIKGFCTYKRITSADKEYVTVDSFQINSYGKFEINFDDKVYVTHFINSSLVPISQKQYTNAFNKMLKYIFEQGKKEK